MTKEFQQVKIGERFFYNGSEYEKKSTRTAHLIEYNRRFYFGKKDRCTINKR